MKQVKRNELEKGKKYWLEAEFITDDGGVYRPLCFDFEERRLWLCGAANIFLLEEGKAEESPKYLKYIIKKLKELDEHNRMVWLNRIMDAFGVEIRTKAYSRGFEQGKFEGTLEREKVKIPQFVADRIEEVKRKDEGLFECLRGKKLGLSDEILDWFAENENEREELVARAFLDGYEVEKEPLYWVRDKNGESILVKVLGNISVSSGYNIDYQRNYRNHYTFTEKEIKEYDERYWAFAVPVEEE